VKLLNNVKNGKSTFSMEALLAKYSSSQIKAPSRGDKVKGKVIQKLPKKLVMDIGGKSEGIVAEKAFEEARGFIDNLEIGDEVEAVVLIPKVLQFCRFVRLHPVLRGINY